MPLFTTVSMDSEMPNVHISGIDALVEKTLVKR
jgi:hypothetical protein